MHAAARQTNGGLDWFEALLGFRETDEAGVKEKIVIAGSKLRSNENGAEYSIGEFSTPSLQELREKAGLMLQDSDAVAKAKLKGKTGVKSVLGDVAEYHCKKENRLALFQVASQLNCLEFTSPNVTPEVGVTGYSRDRTQGPCCAVACGAGTVFRNYFAPVRDASGAVTREGQSADCQIECLRDMEAALENGRHRYLRVQGGYTLADDEGIEALSRRLAESDEQERDLLRAKLRVGVQSGVQVTARQWGRVVLDDSEQLVTQVFGSACSVSYSRNRSVDCWEPMARLILEASYEATLWAAVLSALSNEGRAGSRSVFLTALGGGVFGNSMSWIKDAILRAVDTVCTRNGLALQINLVSYCEPVDPCFLDLVLSHGQEDRVAAVHEKRRWLSCFCELSPCCA